MNKTLRLKEHFSHSIGRDPAGTQTHPRSLSLLANSREMGSLRRGSHTTRGLWRVNRQTVGTALDSHVGDVAEAWGWALDSHVGDVAQASGGRGQDRHRPQVLRGPSWPCPRHSFTRVLFCQRPSPHQRIPACFPKPGIPLLGMGDKAVHSIIREERPKMQTHGQRGCCRQEFQSRECQIPSY